MSFQAEVERNIQTEKDKKVWSQNRDRTGVQSVVLNGGCGVRFEIFACALIVGGPKASNGKSGRYDTG